MMNVPCFRATCISLVALLLPLSALAGQWLTPGWGANEEPSFDPVYLYYMRVKDRPIIYRSEIDVPAGTTRATVQMRTTGYVILSVDGQQLYSWAPSPADKQKNKPAVPADPSRVHSVDLSDALTPGRHVVTVSAPREGFVMDGAVYAGTERLGSLGSDGEWRVIKLAPTTILEGHEVTRIGYSGPAAAVQTGDSWTASEEALANVHFEARVSKAKQRLADAMWHLQLITERGIYLVDDAARGFAGPGRIDPQHIAAARTLVKTADQVKEQLDALSGNRPENAGAMTITQPWISDLEIGLASLESSLAKVAQAIGRDDEELALRLASSVVGVDAPTSPSSAADLAAVRAALETRLGHPQNNLNESRHDRLGWMDLVELVDADLGPWGIRINPVSGPTLIKAPDHWLFSTDPEKQGERELRHTIGYNIENQWPKVDVTKSWTADKRYAAYAGVAWYRTRIRIPSEWTGHPVRIAGPVEGAARLWLNDRELQPVETKSGREEFLAPADVVAYGGENVVALRVDAAGEKRGLQGLVEFSCPALADLPPQETPPVEVMATALSPCVLLTPRTASMNIHHAGETSLLLPAPGGTLRQAQDYNLARDGKLPANWALIWMAPTSEMDTVRPILLVFEQQPVSIQREAGLVRLQLAKEGARVVAVRPWVGVTPSLTQSESIISTVATWSRAALAIPTNYVSVTRIERRGSEYDTISIDRIPDAPVLSHTLVYDYLTIADEWKTPPLRVAPLPVLLSFALDHHYRGLRLAGSEPQQFRDAPLPSAPLAAAYRALPGTDRITYSYPLEPFPRFIGFTSWMFADADAGVPGNKREAELMALAGGNSYRPQHNWSDEKPAKDTFPGNGFPADETRTRLELTADFCNEVGLNYMNNIDQTLGPNHKLLRDDYPAFIQKVYTHFDKVVPQLAKRPFWAAAYDLINEPFGHKAPAYNGAMKELTRRIRETDRTHLLYVEACESWAAVQQLPLVKPTGDPLTLYSFHDYNFRLHNATDRWPTLDSDRRNIYRMFLPAFEYQLRHGIPLHCGEYGGFYANTNESLAQFTLLNDFFAVFDQFGMHHHYYSGREMFRRQADGTLRASNVVPAFQRYMSRPDVNALYPRWPGQPNLAAPKEKGE